MQHVPTFNMLAVHRKKMLYRNSRHCFICLSYCTLRDAVITLILSIYCNGLLLLIYCDGIQLFRYHHSFSLNQPLSHQYLSFMNGKQTRMQKVLGTFLSYKVLKHLYSSMLRHSYSSHLLPSSTSSLMTDMRVIKNINRVDWFYLFVQLIKNHEICTAQTFRSGQYVYRLLPFYRSASYSFNPHTIQFSTHLLYGLDLTTYNRLTQVDSRGYVKN